MPEGRVHGGLDPDELAAHGLAAERVLDFSVNVNPYGPSRGMAEAVLRAPLDRYPDPRARRARAALAAQVGVPAERIALGNGAAELLWTLARLLVRPGGRVLVVEPTFCEPALAARATGAELVSWRAGENLTIDLGAVAAQARVVAPAFVYLCNPNNPTGFALPAAALVRFAEALGDTTLVLDEAFLSVSTAWRDAQVPLPENVVRVRSLTKEHTLPGLRVGYLIGCPSLVARLEEARPAWTVSAGAQAAAEASVAEEGFVAESRARWLADAAALASDLRGLGLAPLPSTTPYLLVRVGEAAAVRERLLAKHAIAVRDCASFGLPRFLRLGARPAADRARLVAALRVVLAA